MKEKVIFISDHPMTLGIQFIISYLNSKSDIRKHYDLKGILSSTTDYSCIEVPYTNRERIVLLKYIVSQKPIVIGLSTIERTRLRTLAILPNIKKVVPNSILIAGGIDAVSKPNYYLARGLDMVAMGDGELAVEVLLTRLITGEKRESIILNPPKGFYTNCNKTSKAAPILSILPLPYYGENLLQLTYKGLIPPSKMFGNSGHVQFSDRRFAIDTFTQRGCTHKCSFCAQDLFVIYKNNRRRNVLKCNVQNIIDHIIKVKLRYPYKNIVYFWDLDFLRKSKSFLLDFAQKYQKKVAIPFFVFVTEKSVVATGIQILKKLVDAGLESINMGIQSGSERILKECYCRNNTPIECIKAISIIHQATKHKNIEILYDIITYNPSETPDEILETINTIIGIPVDGNQKIRLCTHKLSMNTGQPHKQKETTTNDDYQDFMRDENLYKQTQSPYLSWLLGQMMRGKVTATSIGSIHRKMLPSLLNKKFIKQMDSNTELFSIIYKAFIPRENEVFSQEIFQKNDHSYS